MDIHAAVKGMIFKQLIGINSGYGLEIRDTPAPKNSWGAPHPLLGQSLRYMSVIGQVCCWSCSALGKVITEIVYSQ